MNWLFALSAVLTASVVPVVVAADDTAREVVERAIQAQGGADKITKLRVMRIKAKGTIELVPGQPAVSVVIEDWWQMPNQYKSKLQFKLGANEVSQTNAINGDVGWIQVNGMTQDMPKDALAEMRKQKYAEDLDRLGFLNDKEKELRFLGAAKVGDRDAAGVLVTSKGHPDVALYFDRENGLLVKRAHKVLDPRTGKEILQEIVFGDYRETDGVHHYRTLTGYRDGVRFTQVIVTETEFYDKLDEKVFRKP